MTERVRFGGILPILLTCVALPAQGPTSTWNQGDVFTATGVGNFKVWTNAGVFKETIVGGGAGFNTST